MKVGDRVRVTASTVTHTGLEGVISGSGGETAEGEPVWFVTLDGIVGPSMNGQFVLFNGDLEVIS